MEIILLKGSTIEGDQNYIRSYQVGLTVWLHGIPYVQESQISVAAV